MKWLAAFALSLIAGTAVAQTPPPQAQPAPPRYPAANNVVGISIDRFIGDASKSPSRVSHDVMLTRSILRAGDPLQPGDAGAVLRHTREVVVATLGGHNATPLVQVPEQLIFVIDSGEGRLDDGRNYWDLKPGIAFVVPPNVPHRLTNTGSAPLQSYMLTRELEPEVTRRTSILVRDINTLVFTERNVHWSNMAKYVFSGLHPDDGFNWNDRLYIVYMGPMTIAGPHPHTPEQEEVWIKMTDGDALMQLGSEIRRWPKDVGFLAPPNGQTVHAAINTSDEMQAWLYFNRLSHTPRDPNAPPRPVNPVIDEALQRATVAGRPLSQLGR